LMGNHNVPEQTQKPGHQVKKGDQKRRLENKFAGCHE
jgi:hypothetical protein